jgi:hypothetical protein
MLFAAMVIGMIASSPRPYDIGTASGAISPAPALAATALSDMVAGAVLNDRRITPVAAGRIRARSIAIVEAKRRRCNERGGHQLSGQTMAMAVSLSELSVSKGGILCQLCQKEIDLSFCCFALFKPRGWVRISRLRLGGGGVLMPMMAGPPHRGGWRQLGHRVCSSCRRA